MTREMTDEDGTIDADAARGRVVPRESDERKLREWNEHLQGNAPRPNDLDGVA